MALGNIARKSDYSPRKHLSTPWETFIGPIKDVPACATPTI